MNFNIALLRGDGIGPEIVDSAVAVLKKVAEKYGHTFQFTPYLIGGCAIDATGVPLPQETIDGCLASDSVLLGAVGGAVGQVGCNAAASASGKGPARYPGSIGTLHQPASGKTVPGIEGRLSASGRYRSKGL